MSKYLLTGLIAFILVGCISKGNNIEGEWEHEAQYDYENHTVYIFTHDKYQIIINGEELELPLSYKISDDSIFMDRGEHWIPVVGIHNRYIKESYSISNKGTTLILGDLILKKVK